MHRDLPTDIDILVIGGGNAALCAAMSAREAGAKVLLLESAPRDFRGGNSRHTRNLRYAHGTANDHLTGPYHEDEFWADLMKVTGGRTNEALARLTVSRSRDIGTWVEAHGGRFQPAMRGTLHLARTNGFFLGGGKALINAYYRTAFKRGVIIRYNAEVLDLDIRNGAFLAATVRFDDTVHQLRAGAMVAAAGGFEANREWLQRYWGPAARNFIVRGSPYNRGRVLGTLLERGARPVADPRQCHAVAIDARAPRFDGGIVTRLDCVPFGIVVNKHCQRFHDEGEDFWPKKYAVWGRLVAAQAEQTAYVIIDSKAIDLFMPSVFPPVKADSIGQLATALGLDPQALAATVHPFNRAVQPGRFDPSVLDECRTKGLDPPKSHWARPLDTPPFYGYPLRPGITFTYHGVTVNRRAQIIMENGCPVANAFAAGEIMAGNILGRGYLAGFGMTIGTVFGTIAGREAAHYVLTHPRRG